MAKTEKTIILMGLEAPEIVDNLDPNKVVWRPKGTDPHFKMLVKRALVEFMARNVQDEWKWDISSADVAVFRNGVDFAHQLRKGKYTRAVIYAHGDQWQLMPKLNDRSTHVRPYALAKALGEAGIRQALLLGCNSRQLAETAARVLEGYTRIGGIDQIRSDDVDKRHTRMTILNMIIWPYGGQR